MLGTLPKQSFDGGSYRASSTRYSRSGFEGLLWGDTLFSSRHSCRVAAQHTLHVALTEPLVRYVGGQVTSGRYATASEVVRAALRLLIERDEAALNRQPKSETPADV